MIYILPPPPSYLMPSDCFVFSLGFFSKPLKTAVYIKGLRTVTTLHCASLHSQSTTARVQDMTRDEKQ